MKPATRRVRDALADLGIPRAAIRACTNRAVTYAIMRTDEARRMVDEKADLIAGPGHGVIIRRRECGCVDWAVITTDPRHAGKVDRVTYPPGTHQCDTHEGNQQ